MDAANQAAILEPKKTGKVTIQRSKYQQSSFQCLFVLYEDKTYQKRSIVILNVEQLRRWQWLLLAFLLLVVFIGTGIGIGSNIIINLINVAIIWS